MYLNLRRYPRIGVGREVIEHSVAAELLAKLRGQAGFGGYCAFWDGEGAGVSISLFDDAEAAHRSTEAARQWVMGHRNFFPERGEELSGECVAHEGSLGVMRDAGKGRQLPYLLVRELNDVPATQDTQAFIQQRTLPLITRWPGFIGVYMARSDMVPARAAVVTLFDTMEQAYACHGKAVELLREGLLNVTVSRVAGGRAVLLDGRAANAGSAL